MRKGLYVIMGIIGFLIVLLIVLGLIDGTLLLKVI